jgi:hypothetical protein
MKRIAFKTLTLSIALAFATAAHAETLDVYDTIDGDMIVGDGIPIDNFTQDHEDPLNQSVSVALRARDRDTGQANALVGNRYFVDPGISSASATSPNFMFDYQFDPGTDNVTDYYLHLSVDFDPGFGSTDFAVIGDNISGFWDDTDGYFTTNTDGHGSTNTWNDTSVPYVVSNSWHLDYAFWSIFNPDAALYDPNEPGEYELRLEAFDAAGGNLLASTTAYAEVVPEPSSVALAGVGLASVGFFMWRRRRHRQAIGL